MPVTPKIYLSDIIGHEYLAQLDKDLRHFEGVRDHQYNDALKNPTWGCGRLAAKGFYPSEIDLMLQNDMAQAAIDLDGQIKNWRGFTPNRQIALLNMIFNLGPNNFAGFSKMKAAIANNDWELAAFECASPKWIAQVGTARVDYISDLLRQG